MSSLSRRIADLKTIVGNREPDGPPTWCFFALERFQAVANYGGDSPDVVLDDIEHVERIIPAYDELRRQHHLDVVDTTILIARNSFPSDNPSASGIAGMIVGAWWAWDSECYGETKAWSMQRNRSDIEPLIAGRLGALNVAVTRVSS